MGHGLSLSAGHTIPLWRAGHVLRVPQEPELHGGIQRVGDSLQFTLKQEDFLAQEQLHDQLDGRVTSCALDALASGLNPDSNITLSVAMTRSKLGAVVGTVGFQAENGSWRISEISPTVEGTELAPLLTGIHFCTLFVAGNLQEAYTLLSMDAQQAIPFAQFQSTDYFGVPSGFKLVSCTPNLETYKVNAELGSYDSTLKVQRLNPSATFDITLTLDAGLFSEGWRIDGWKFAQG